MKNIYIIIDKLGARHATIKANNSDEALDIYNFPGVKHLLYAVRKEIYDILIKKAK